MTWRKQRRRELLRLGVTDPALLTIRYYELAEQDGSPGPVAGNLPLGAMIDTILDEEEVLHHCGAHKPRTPIEQPERATESTVRPA
jgi:hypothetical protein